MVVPSSGFTYPPTNGSIPPALAIDFHLEYNPNHLFAILHNVEDFTQIEITYELLAHAVHRAAHILNPNGTIPQGTNVGFLVSTHTIEYVVMIMGAMRAGLVPFPISPRTHIPGIAHLITTTQTKYIVSGGSKVVDDVATQLRDALSSSHFVAEYIQLPSLEEVLPSLGHIKTQGQYTPFPPLKPFGDDSIVNILHSSGSTGLPRPIQYHLEGVIKNVVKQPLGWIYSGGNVTVGTMALPTFHTMGMLLQVILPLYVGYTQVLFAPSKSPVVPTSNLTIQAVASTNCEYLICVPTFLEMWAQDEDAIARLCEMKGVMFGGGSLADVIGNKLVDRGVSVHSCYGATEFGAVNEVQDHDDPSDWGYVKFSQRVGTRFVPQNDEDRTFELIFVETEAHKPFVLNSELDGMPAYRTKDLVVQHPQKPELWKFVGRLDDQIVLLNGEKTNPGPMEAEIVKSPIVSCAIMFGRERNQTGVLIELTPNASGDKVAEDHRAKLVEEIWPYVELANQASPTHSRLAKSAVIFVDPARPLPRTPKGTVPRSAALKLYSCEIEEMYVSLEKYAEGTEDIGTPESWSDHGIVEAWVQACVADILGQDVDPTGDLFQQGMDSLTATILLRTLKGVLHASPDPIVQNSAKQINQQTIFGKPTVRQLSNLLVQLCTNSSDSGLDPVAEALESIHMMIEKYNYDWVPSGVDATTHNQPVVQERVVVTGTTGGLGSHLLAQLLASDKVDRVWALNRKSGKDNLARQQASFEDKQLDIKLLAGGKLVMLDTDLEDSRLGLCDEIYDEIRDQATIIIHNAWQVNFNLSLQSFEPSIRGARNLLDLAVKSTATTGMPRFAFASSISVAGFGEPGRRLSEAPVKPEDGAAGIGYGQSKLVTEKLLESARLAGLQTCSVRLGQLTGDVKSGAWTSTDWVPSLIGSSVSTGCLPEAVGTISWLPLDIAAHSIIDTCTSRHEDLPLVIHTSHPRPVPWVDVMSAFSAVLSSLPLVRFDEWNKRVVENAAAFEGSESDRYKRFPSTKIQSTVDGMVRADESLRARGVTGDVESGGTVRLDTSEAERLSEALKVTSQVGKEHVEKWVGYWGKMGLFL